MQLENWTSKLRSLSQSHAYLKSIINLTCAKENKVQISCKNDNNNNNNNKNKNKKKKIKGK